ncbi:MAG: hypothetical protein CMG07_02560 [Candidatus Marinimicrobia bacterium]|nr:hypothetical protein [Candidatus Neomarinimicrobiota bacterium]
MLKKITLQNLGEGIENVEVTEINIKQGDDLKIDDIILTVETEKASMEIASEHNGLVKNIFIDIGQEISPKTELIEIDIKKPQKNKKSLVNNNVSPEQSNNIFILPDIGEGIDNVLITEVNVSQGDNVTKDETVITVETEKASMEIPINLNGKIIDMYVKKEDTISPGSKILSIETTTNFSDDSNIIKDSIINQDVSKKDDEIKTSSLTNHSIVNDEVNEYNKISNHIYTSPSVRRFARKLGCDLSLVNGTGRKGRILKEDVEKYISSILSGQNQISNSAIDIDFSIFGPVKNKKLNKIKITTGNRLSNAWSTIPQVTQFDEADISLLTDYRKSVNTKNKKISFLPFFVKALVPLLKEYPNFNSSLTSSKKNLILKKYFNVGIAVDTPNGLIVPVIKNVNQKDVFTLMDELTELSEKCRNKQIKPSDLQGSCITISSLGGIGGTYFTPIVNPPEVAIIGISKSKVKPFFIDGKFEPRTMLPISLTYDHRVIDGAEAARFTKSFCHNLANIKEHIKS